MSWRLRIACALAIAGLAGLALACGDGGSTAGGEGQRLRVVTSIGIFADFARQIGGDRVEVTSLLPPGADPHTFEPTPRDVQKLSEADVVFINGLGLEGGLERTIENTVGEDTRIERFVDSYPAGTNPHIWLSDPVAYVKHILDVLNQADPNTTYMENYDRYVEQLQRLNDEIEQKIASIPPERRKLVTFHDSFQHLADRYGLEVIGFVVASPGGDPSPADLAKLLAAIRDRGVPAVFVEPQFKAGALERLADEAGVRVCTLYSDALDGEVRTYIEMMRFNANELSRCLGEVDGY